MNQKKDVANAEKDIDTKEDSTEKVPDAQKEYDTLLADANTYYENGDIDSAVKTYHLAIEKMPEQREAYTALIQIQKECALFDDAEQTLALGKQNNVELAYEEEYLHNYKEDYTFVNELSAHLTDDYDAALEWISTQYTSHRRFFYFQNNKLIYANTDDLCDAYAIIYRPNLGVYCGNIAGGHRQGNGRQYMALPSASDSCVIDGAWGNNYVNGFAEVYFPHYYKDDCRAWVSGNFTYNCYDGDITLTWQDLSTGSTYSGTGHASMGFWQIIREEDGKKIYAESPEGRYWYLCGEQTYALKLPSVSGN